MLTGRQRRPRQQQADVAKRQVSGELTADDIDVEHSLRPQTLAEYCGQERVCDNLRVLIQAARDRGEP